MVATVCAVVPVKPLVSAKSRLAGVLSPAEREKLSVWLLERTLDVLSQARGLMAVMVASRDPVVWDLARRHGAQVVVEGQASGLNAALQQAIHSLPEGVGAALILPADLPLVQADDVESMLADDSEPAVVIAPDWHERGTNALLIRPPQALDCCFGEDSFSRHLIQATRKGMRVHVRRRPTLALDLDLPVDLALWQQMARPAGERALLERSAVIEAPRIVSLEGRSR